MARMLGYDVTIVDPRTAFATPERFPDVKVIAEWPDEALPPLGIDRYTAFVALTHDPKIDDPALTHALSRECFYIGALGLEEDAWPAGRAAEGARRHRRADRAHPCADRARYRRGVAGGDRGRRSWREITARAAPGRTARVMKFGPVPRRGGARRHRRSQHPPGRLRAQKGHGDRRRGCRGARRRREFRDVVVARLDAGDIGEDEAAARDCRARSAERRAMPTAPSPAAAICSRERPACWWSTGPRSTRSTASTRRSPSRRCRPSSRWSPAR